MSHWDVDLPACQDVGEWLFRDGWDMSTEKHKRLRVARAIKLALARIAKQDPALAQLLRESIKTGTYLSYSTAGTQPVPRSKRKYEREKSTPPPSHRNGPIAH